MGDTPPRSGPKLSPTRLLHGASTLFGRKRVLEQLARAWADEHTHVVTIVAWGGVGKTALVNEYRNRLLREPGGLECVFDWSFYSQGTRDCGAVSADGFIREALRFFGDPELAESAASGWEKGARLAELVGSRRALLILDGLEPLQRPPPPKGRVGELKEESIAALLKGLAGCNRGLCLVTTRVGVHELAGFEGTTALRMDLEHLSEDTGAALLRNMLGLGECRDTELREVTRALDGHALSLELLGSYIRRARLDVRAWREIDFSDANEVQGGHAFRVMEAYSRWLGQEGPAGEQQLAVLRLLGLFDRSADPGCVAALREAPTIAGLTEALVGVEGVEWRLLLSSLEDARLLRSREFAPELVCGYDEAAARAAGDLEEPKGEPQPWPTPALGAYAVVLDAHPLVREYFGNQLRRTNEAGWREGHRRLYRHLCRSVPHWPEGLEGLQPLYQAVVHGCAAGQVEEVFWAVYLDRIARGAGRYYSTRQLGAFSADLAAVACSFEGGWDRPSTKLSVSTRAWVLGVAAHRLRGLGRLREALAPTRVGLELLVEGEDWRNAALQAGSLSELELTLGRTRAAMDAGQQAVDHADRSEDDYERVSKRTTLADVRLALGQLADARVLFEEAEAIETRRYPHFPELASLSGHRYCDLLLCPAERAAWRGAANGVELIELCTEISARATRTLEAAVSTRNLLLIGLDHLTLGRAALYAATLNGEAAPTIVAAGQSLAAARRHLEAAVGHLRRFGKPKFLARGLLTRAWLNHLTNHPTRARADLDEAWALAERGPMPLVQADIHLHRARLFHDRSSLTAARQLITTHEYNRRLPELEDAELAAQSWPPPMSP